MSNRPPLQDIIYTTELWRRIDSGYAPYTRKASPTEAYTALYFEDDFYEIDPRLPVVLADMSNQFGGRWLTLPLEYWRTKKASLPGRQVEEGPSPPDFEVRYLRGFDLDTTTNLVTVTFAAYEMRTSVTGMPYPTGHIPRKAIYHRSVVDERIPHWEERYALGITLELDESELTSYIVSIPDPLKPIARPEALPEINFD